MRLQLVEFFWLNLILELKEHVKPHSDGFSLARGRELHTIDLVTRPMPVDSYHSP